MELFFRKRLRAYNFPTEHDTTTNARIILDVWRQAYDHHLPSIKRFTKAQASFHSSKVTQLINGLVWHLCGPPPARVHADQIRRDASWIEHPYNADPYLVSNEMYLWLSSLCLVCLGPSSWFDGQLRVFFEPGKVQLVLRNNLNQIVFGEDIINLAQEKNNHDVAFATLKYRSSQ